jgi:hypothetical protein
VPGEVQNLEGSIAKIDDISLIYDAGDLGRENSEVSHVVVRGRKSRQHRPCKFIFTDRWHKQGGDVGWIEVSSGERVLPFRALQPLRLTQMYNALLELMMISNVVDVDVGCNRGRGFVKNVPCELAKTDNAHSGINYQVAITSAHMPDVAAEKWDDVRLEDESDVVVDPTKLEPCFGDLEHSLFG